MFPYEFCKIFKNICFVEHLQATGIDNFRKSLKKSVNLGFQYLTLSWRRSL